MFREERLTELMGRHRGSAHDLAKAILAAVANFAGAAEQSDDQTLVVIRRT